MRKSAETKTAYPRFAMAVISSGNKATFLKFDNIDRTDAGQYTCRANNSVEVTSIDTSIVVLCKYILTLFPNRKLRIGKNSVGWEITVFFTDSWDQLTGTKIGWN